MKPQLQQLYKNMQLLVSADLRPILSYCESMYHTGISKDDLISIVSKLYIEEQEDLEKEDTLDRLLNILYGYSPAHYNFPFMCVLDIPPRTIRELMTS